MSGRSATSSKRRRKGKGGGRPSELTPENHARIINAISTTACSFGDAGLICDPPISPRTISRWRTEGEKDDERGKDTPERKFWRETSQAAAKLRVLLAGRVVRSSTWDGRLALQLLERRDPTTFGARSHLDVRDVTPPGPSPRKRVLDRLSAIEERMNQAERLGLSTDARDVSGPTDGTQ